MQELTRVFVGQEAALGQLEVSSAGGCAELELLMLEQKSWAPPLHLQVPQQWREGGLGFQS